MALFGWDRTPKGTQFEICYLVQIFCVKFARISGYFKMVVNEVIAKSNQPKILIIPKADEIILSYVLI